MVVSFVPPIHNRINMCPLRGSRPCCGAPWGAADCVPVPEVSCWKLKWAYVIVKIIMFLVRLPLGLPHARCPVLLQLKEQKNKLTYHTILGLSIKSTHDIALTMYLRSSFLDLSFGNYSEVYYLTSHVFDIPLLHLS